VVGRVLMEAVRFAVQWQKWCDVHTVGNAFARGVDRIGRGVDLRLPIAATSSLFGLLFIH